VASGSGPIATESRAHNILIATVNTTIATATPTATNALGTSKRLADATTTNYDLAEGW